MLTQFVCLANSYKEGGRCLAGVQLDEAGHPVIVNRRPKWLRPVCHTSHQEIPTCFTQNIHVLDIVQVDVTGYAAEGHQSENAFIDEGSLRVVGHYRRDHLAPLCEVRPVIFGSRGKAIPEERIELLGYSLMMVNTKNFEVVDHVYEDAHHPKTRLVFTYNMDTYDLPITDPEFLRRYKLDPSMLEDVGELFLTLSLGVNWQHFYYKLIGCVLYQ